MCYTITIQVIALLSLFYLTLATPVTENVESVYCAANVEGSYDLSSTGNVIDTVQVQTKAACEAECTVIESCNFFTVYGNSSGIPWMCYLLTELREPITYCQDGTCVSGSPNCDQSLCGFLEDGVLHPNGIVITESKDVDLILIGSCGSPLAIAVGGGGTTQDDAGSGSGYVEFVELSINGPYKQFSATVGSAQQESQLTDAADGSVLLTANPGGDGGTFEGAAGYSGGGADCSTCPSPGGDGGSDGADGGDSIDNVGGQGSGFDISSIPLRNIALSPGSGGKGGDSSGGGGGGVLVDGNGPSGGGEEHGDGYGAGGGGVWYDELTATGYDGVILLDLI